MLRNRIQQSLAFLGRHRVFAGVIGAVTFAGSLASIISLFQSSQTIERRPSPHQERAIDHSTIDESNDHETSQHTESPRSRIGSESSDANPTSIDGEAKAPLPGSDMRHRALGETFELEPGENAAISDLQTVVAVSLVERGVQDAEALRKSVYPARPQPVSGTLIGDYGILEFESQSEAYRAAFLRHQGQVPKVAVTVTKRSHQE